MLGDAEKTAVMTQRGIAAAVGLSKPGGKDFERLVGGKGISKHLGAEALAKVMQPIEFKGIYPGAKGGGQAIKGYSAAFLVGAVAGLGASLVARCTTPKAICEKFFLGIPLR